MCSVCVDNVQYDVHMDLPGTPITRWLRTSRGTMSQADLVADLERVTGWHLLRENYSKYETGRMTPEPDTLARFEAYWRTRGVDGPDLTPSRPQLSLEERAVIAAEEQARQAKRQADALEQLVRLLSARSAPDLLAELDSAAAAIGVAHEPTRRPASVPQPDTERS